MRSIHSVVLVGTGGFVGSAARYAVSGLAHTLAGNTGFPWGTAAVNVVGCFGMGILAGLADHASLFSPGVRLFLSIGILGGFTTFSTFGYETAVLLRDRQLLAALGNVGINLGAGLAAVVAGLGIVYWIGR